MTTLSVYDLVGYIRDVFANDPILADVWVHGEVSNLKHHSSGHLYFTLKDQDAAISAVMWRSYVQRLGVDAIPANGTAVLARGAVSVYEKSGQMQLYVHSLQPVGAGLLHAQFEAIRQSLADEGLFEPSRKRALPPLPHRIGIATSPQAAAYQDMLNVLRRRYPLAQVLLAPCVVQGEQAPASICAALHTLYANDVDVIILARGGGSLEDLWAFNDERIARTIFASPVPVVTGVGHETDTTIVDYVADVRAPTPSAAAELVAPDVQALLGQIGGYRTTLDLLIESYLTNTNAALVQINRSLHRHHPTSRIATTRQQVDELLQRADRATEAAQERKHMYFVSLRARLHALSPHATLQRGYALLHAAESGALISTSAAVQSGDAIQITLHDGTLHAEVQHVQAAPSQPKGDMR